MPEREKKEDDIMAFGIENHPFIYFQYLWDSYVKHFEAAGEPVVSESSASELPATEPVANEPAAECKVRSCDQIGHSKDIYFPDDTVLTAVFESGSEECKEPSDIAALMKCAGFYSDTYMTYLNIREDSRCRLEVVREVFSTECLDTILVREPRACDYAWQMANIVKQQGAADAAIGRMEHYVDLAVAAQKVDAAAKQVEERLKIFNQPMNDEEGNVKKQILKEATHIKELKNEKADLERKFNKAKTEGLRLGLEDVAAELEQAEAAKKGFDDIVIRLQDAINNYNTEDEKFLDAVVEAEFVAPAADALTAKWNQIVADAETALKGADKVKEEKTKNVGEKKDPWEGW